MTSPQPTSHPEPKREVRVGDQECPRCKESFTISYWSDGSLIQAKCLSCEMKWPLPRVV
jgi:hypothetical protein